MKKLVRTHLYLKLAFFLFVVFALVKIFPHRSEEAIIKDLCTEISQLASYEEQAPLFERLAKTKKILQYLDKDLRITGHFDDGTKKVVKGKNKISDKILAGFEYLDKLAISCDSLSVQIDIDQARVKCTARVLGRERGREDLFFEEHPVEIQLIKKDGEWVIQQLQNKDRLKIL